MESGRYSIRTRAWAAAACWRLLSALQIPRDDCCFMGYSALEVLENVSEAQVDEKVFPSIADLDVPLAIRRGNKVSWDLKRGEQWKEFPYNQRS